MQPLGKRVLLLMALGLLAVPVTAVGVAYACTALAVVSTNSDTVAVGSTVTVNGKYFAPHDASDIRTAPAVIRLDRVDGPALATASPSAASAGGAFSVEVTVPDVEPGQHALVVTQNGINGSPAYGTPARTVLTVTPAPARAADVAAAAPAAAAPLAAALATPATTPAPVTRPKPTRAQRIAACKAKHKISSAKTKRGRKRIAARRASCIRAAIRATSSSS